MRDMRNDTAERNNGPKKVINDVDHKDVAAQNETSSTPPAVAKMKQVGIDTRSREAFELLKIGEAICNLQVDQRRMRMDAEDMRFERDRYKASAAAFQDKLAAALTENNRLRDLREVLRTMSQHKESDLASQARADDERAHLTAALQASEQQAEEVRHAHAQVREQLNRAMHDNETLSSELQSTKVAMERMRHAYIDLTRKLLAETRPESD